jgi:hypothetical protein
MENEQIQEYCEEALKISKVNGIQNGLSYLIGGKFRRSFLQLKKARKKLQFLYPSKETSNYHPLDKGGRALKMSYALTIQEHYSIPLEQVKHYELFLKEFVVGIKNAFSLKDIRNYFDSSLQLGPLDQGLSNLDLDFSNVLQEAEEILATEDIKRLFF